MLLTMPQCPLMPSPIHAARLQVAHEVVVLSQHGVICENFSLVFNAKQLLLKIQLWLVTLQDFQYLHVCRYSLLDV